MQDDDNQISFDTDKSERNFKKRGFDFVYAARIFDEPLFFRIDLRRDYGEERIQVFGRIDKKPYLVVYTLRNKIKHIISAFRCKEKVLQKLLSFPNPTPQLRCQNDHHDDNDVLDRSTKGPGKLGSS